MTALRPTVAGSAPAGQPVVMGVLNVTPDSFSDGGRYADLDAAVAHAVELREDGADLIDVGGESTRPGRGRVDAATEAARVLPVIRELAAAGVPMSIDTTRAAVAEAALAAGAAMVNDVSGGLADPDMAARGRRAPAAPGCSCTGAGTAAEMQQLATYADVVKEVRDELRRRVDAAIAAGVAPERIILDPGLGFAKRPEHNWRLSAHLDEIIAPGLPGAGRRQPQVVPGRAAGRPGRHAPPDRRAGGGDGGDQRAGRPGRRLGRAGPRVRATVTRCGCWPRRRGGAMSADTIRLTGLRARGHHGVFDFERAQGQDFVVDVVLELDLAPAGRHRRRRGHRPLRRAGGGPGRDRHRRAGEPHRDARRPARRRLPGRSAGRRGHRHRAQAAGPDPARLRRRERDAAPPPTRRADDPGTVRVTRAVLSLGSNLGDRAGHLRQAVRQLGDAVLVVSGVYETPPWGDPDQPAYLNAVVLVAGAEDADGWLRPGRRRWSGRPAGSATRARRFGPRTLDVDVIAVWTDDGEPDLSATDAELTLPHPRAHLRAFVLRPWLDIAPYAQLPGHGWLADLMRTPAVANDVRT